MKQIKNSLQISYKSVLFALCVSGCVFLSACSSSDKEAALTEVEVSNASTHTFQTNVLVPESSGENIIGSNEVSIDISNVSEGYIVVTYTGECAKVKLQLSVDGDATYTYNLTPSLETVIPLSSGDGTYLVTVYENIGNDQYASNFSDCFDVTISNTFGPFLYPNQYVNFNKDTKAVKIASELTTSATTELEAVACVYSYVASNIVYDKEEAETVESSYLPDVDEVLETGKGICFDYASLMAAMLRSIGIPTRLEIGYAKDAYHAWISVYTQDQGWIGGVIQFDGSDWSLMDPTLAANAKDSKKIKQFIGDGTSYTVKYIY